MKEQKILKVFSIIALILGIFGIIAGILMFVLGGAAVGNVDALTTEGITTEQVGTFTGVFVVTGITTLLAGVFNLINSIALRKVSKNAAKYKGAKFLTVVSLVFAVISLVSALLGGQGIKELASGAFSVLLNGYLLSLINKVRDSLTA